MYFYEAKKARLSKCHFLRMELVSALMFYILRSDP